MKSLLRLFAAAFASAFAFLDRRFPSTPEPEEIAVAAYKDLLTTLNTDLATQSSDAATLATATVAKAHSDTDVAAATLAFASAVHTAPGGFVVDATGTTVTLYQSADGVAFSSTVIASIVDPVPSSTPTP